MKKFTVWVLDVEDPKTGRHGLFAFDSEKEAMAHLMVFRSNGYMKVEAWEL